MGKIFAEHCYKYTYTLQTFHLHLAKSHTTRDSSCGCKLRKNPSRERPAIHNACVVGTKIYYIANDF